MIQSIIKRDGRVVLYDQNKIAAAILKALEASREGDANDAEDGSLVHYKNVIGSPVFTIPKLGYVANYIQNPPGTYIAMSGGAILMILVFLPDLLGSEEEEEKKPGKKKKKSATKKGKGGKYLRK